MPRRRSAAAYHPAVTDTWRPLTPDEEAELDTLFRDFRPAYPSLTDREVRGLQPFRLARFNWLGERGLRPEQDPRQP
jgi:hypothetical protein